MAHVMERQPAWQAWRYAPLLAATIAVAGILVLYADTAASIVAIWRRSDTFAHGFVVIPICLWLGWRQRAGLASIVVQPWWPGLVAVLLAGALWLVMAAGGVIGVRQFALAFMVQAAIVTVVGLRAARVLLFPLAFLLFAVPAGEIFVPTLIDWTADFTVAALRVSGVPIYREGNHFLIPSGAWSVVEACSGVRYLIASVMVGTIYSAVAYRSARRRALFIAASVVVPLVANWLRAYMIVMLGHLSDNKIAVGIDHLIYGWVFFGVVMALLFWIGSFWAEDDAPPAAISGLRSTQLREQDAVKLHLYAAAIAAIAVAAVWRPIHAAIDRHQDLAPPVLTEVAGTGGWRATHDAPSSWRPSYKGFAAEKVRGYEKNGMAAGLYIAYYRQHSSGRELVTSTNALVAPAEARWRELIREDRELNWIGKPMPATRAQIVGNAERLVAWRVFWVDGRMTENVYAAKAWLAWSKLKGNAGDSALVVAFAPENKSGDVAREALEALSPEIARMLDAARGGP